MSSRSSQLEFGRWRVPEPDRNHSLGGRSFYFFDLDDNVLFMRTPIFVFNRQTGEELPLSTREFALIGPQVGKPGPYLDYEVRPTPPHEGSFRRFRDLPPFREGDHPDRTENFIQDVHDMLSEPDFEWKGPSWEFFYHAVFNQRPVSIITARGHHPETLKEGIYLLNRKEVLPTTPSYIGVFPVSNPHIRFQLGDHSNDWSIPALKRAAIFQSVERAMDLYGKNPHHRFGMSDDDPHNIELIVEAMRELKKSHPDNSFFVINTHVRPILKQEVFSDHLEYSEFPASKQLNLF